MYFSPKLKDERKGKMKKVLFLLLFLASSYAGVVDGIAVIVDNEPITLYEIDQAQRELGFSREQAVNFLIKRKVEDTLIKERNIGIDEYLVAERFKGMAEKNGLSLSKFKSAIIRKNGSIGGFYKGIRKQLQREKLYSMIIRSEVQKPTDVELKNYYLSNKNLFSMPTHVELIKYSSFSKNLLREVQRNPMLQNPDIKREVAKIDLRKMNRQILEIILQTKEGSFTEILPVNRNLSMLLYIKNKIGAKEFDFEANKDKVMMIYYKTQESKVLRNFFNKQISDSTITVIR